MTKVNIHIVPSCRSTSHAWMKDKYIGLYFNYHELYFLNNSYPNDAKKYLKLFWYLWHVIYISCYFRYITHFNKMFDIFIYIDSITITAHIIPWWGIQTSWK